MSKIIATRPVEYICVAMIAMPVTEGIAYMIIAQDAFSMFVFPPSIFKKPDNDNLINFIRSLCSNADFLSMLERHHSFTLVLQDFDDSLPNIKELVKPLNGTIIIDEAFVNKTLHHFLFNHMKFEKP